MPADDGTKVRALLRRYVNQRILFYRGDAPQISEAANEAQKLQTELWSRVVQAAAAQSTPVKALAVSGMNDVLNSQAYTQAAITRPCSQGPRRNLQFVNYVGRTLITTTRVIAKRAYDRRQNLVE